MKASVSCPNPGVCGVKYHYDPNNCKSLNRGAVSYRNPVLEIDPRPLESAKGRTSKDVEVDLMLYPFFEKMHDYRRMNGALSHITEIIDRERSISVKTVIHDLGEFRRYEARRWLTKNPDERRGYETRTNVEVTILTDSDGNPTCDYGPSFAFKWGWTVRPSLMWAWYENGELKDDVKYPFMFYHDNNMLFLIKQEGDLLLPYHYDDADAVLMRDAVMLSQGDDPMFSSMPFEWVKEYVQGQSVDETS